jgi:predicted TIM-barrel fold metal-dependent hydrolase
MVVDCHTHIKCAGRENLDISEHIEAAEVVDKCIILAAPDDDPDKANGQLSEYVGKYDQKMVGFVFLNPLTDPVSPRALKSATEKRGLKGVVLYCSQTGFHPAHSLVFQLYESAQELALPVFFHNSPVGPGGFLEFAQPVLLDEIARTFPSLKIIIGNMGRPFAEQTFCLLAKHQNVFGDLSINPSNVWEVYNLVVAAHEQGVMDKLLFGSAFPAARAQQCIETLLGFNRLLGATNLPTVPREDIQRIIERDTLKLLGIK